MASCCSPASALLLFLSAGPIAPPPCGRSRCCSRSSTPACSSRAPPLPLAVAGRQRRLVGRARGLVVRNGRRGRRAAVARGRGRADADHARRPRVVALPRRVGERQRRGAAAARAVLGLIGHALPVLRRGQPAVVDAALAALRLLAVVTLATSATSPPLVDSRCCTCWASAARAAVVVAAWAAAAGWTTTALARGVVIGAYALAWIAAARRERAPSHAGRCVALFIGEHRDPRRQVDARSPRRRGASAPVRLRGAARANVAMLLDARGRGERWERVAPSRRPVPRGPRCSDGSSATISGEWRQLLALPDALYAVFCAYPFAGPRDARAGEPWLVALGATAMAFFAGRQAFEAGGLQSIVGVVPVVARRRDRGVLLRSLLRLEQRGQRDLGPARARRRRGARRSSPSPFRCS